MGESPGQWAFFPYAALGKMMQREEPIGIITDPMGESEITILSPADGIVIGQLESPLVHRGDAVTHIALAKDMEAAEDTLNMFQREYEIDAEVQGAADEKDTL